MSQSKPLQLFLAGMVALIFSVKVQEKCNWCAVALIFTFIVLFVWGILLVIKRKKKVKQLKDKGLL